MTKPIGILTLVYSAAIAAVFITGCSSMRASPLESSPFLTHAELLHPWSERAPWDAVWSSNPGQIMAKNANVRTIYVAPVNTQYLNMKKNAQGQEEQYKKLSPEDIQTMANLMRNNFIDAIKKTPETNLQVVDQQAGADLVFEVALVELEPTRVLLNTVADVGGFVIPGSKAVEDAAAVGGQAAGGAFAAGTIAMEGKISDGAGNVLAEFKDRENDPVSTLPNYRDFEEYGWSRRTAKDWSQQFAEIFSTPADKKIEADSDMSFVPW